AVYILFGRPVYRGSGGRQQFDDAVRIATLLQPNAQIRPQGIAVHPLDEKEIRPAVSPIPGLFFAEVNKHVAPDVKVGAVPKPVSQRINQQTDFENMPGRFQRHTIRFHQRHVGQRDGEFNLTIHLLTYPFLPRGGTAWPLSGRLTLSGGASSFYQSGG